MPPFLPVPVRSLATTDLSTLFPTFPGTKDIRLHPVFKGGLSKWAWRFYTHRLTRAGRWFLSLSTFMFFAASPSLDIQAYVPLAYAGGLWAVTLGAVLFNRPRVGIRATHAGRISAGEVLPVDVEVTQKSHIWGLELNLLPARLPLEIDEETSGGVPIGGLAPGSVRHVRLPLLCKKRGQYTLRGFRVESDFPFGLMNAYREYKTETALLVYPAYAPLARLDMPVGRRHHPGGMALAAHLGDSFEFLGSREFREGDNLRDIDWRATARLGGNPVIREYREEYFLRVGVVLDTWTPQVKNTKENKRNRKELRAERNAQTEVFERAVSLCASVADYLSERDYLIDLFAAGPSLYHLTAGRSLAYLDQMLDLLACVQPSAKEPLPTIEPQIHENLAQITSVVCVFLRWDETRQAFVERLRENGTGVKVILVTGETTDDRLPNNDPSFVTVSGRDADGNSLRELVL